MIQVTLTYEEEVLAHEIGFNRTRAQHGTAKSSYRFNNSGLNYHEFIAAQAEAVGAEIAVAKYFDLTDFKPSLNTFKNEGDVGNKLEVKHTAWIHGHLIVRANDRIDDIAVLVTDKSPTYILNGWIPMRNAKVAKYWRELSKSYWLNQIDLRPMEDFLNSAYATDAFMKISS